MEHIGKNSPLHAAKLAVTAEQAASSAHQAIDQLSDVARPAVARAASRAHHLVDRLSGTTNRVAQRLEKTACRLKDTEQRLVSVSSNYVREHPLKSAGIALAAGFLMSRLVSSRRASKSSSTSRHQETDAKSADRTGISPIAEEW